MQIHRIRKFPTKIVLLALIILIVVINPKILLGIKNFTFNILVKPFNVLSGAKTYFTKVKDLADDNLVLKQRLAALSVELARMRETARENERLHSLLNFKKGLSVKTIVAKVIARDSTDWRRALIINKGKLDGLRERMPCATADGLIGSLVDVGSTSSKVMLITDPNSRIGVMLESSRESGVLTGSPEGVCRVIYLSLDREIKKGEKVLTAGFSAFFPKGIAVGEVSGSKIDKAKLYKYATVTPYATLNKIEEVVCIELE